MGWEEGFPSVIHFPPESMRRAVLQAGRQWGSQLSGWGVSAGGTEGACSFVQALREGSGGLLCPAGLQLGPAPVRNLSGTRREGGFVSSKDTSKAKNYIPGRPKYACLEKLLAFMKSLVRKAGLQMTASERQ